MENSTFQRIIKDSEWEVRRLAKRGGSLEFCNLHQREIIKAAKELIKLYPKADRQIVLISCWLHDIAYYYAKNNRDISIIRNRHHIRGAEIAGNFLKKYRLNLIDTDMIEKCILNHRNIFPYKPKTLEEKIVAVADTVSHFESIFFLTYFKINPQASFRDMVRDNLRELEQDWRDLALLPKSKRLVEKEYRVIKKLLSSVQLVSF